MNPKNLQPRIEMFILIFGLLFWPGTYLIQVPAIDNLLGYRDGGSSIGDIQPATFGNETHDPIFINDNGDFVSLGFPGAGTEDDPYLIEGYNITWTSGILIDISNTNVHFVIRNNLLDGLDGANIGINLQNVVNGTMENNTVHDMVNHGINLHTATNNTILSNDIFNNRLGIEIRSSSSVIVTQNKIANTYENAITLWDTIESEISRNTFYNCLSGIWAFRSSNNLIESNIISEMIFDGIYGSIIMNNTIVFNDIFRTRNGIWIEENSIDGSSSNNIWNNTIYDNDLGIGVDQSDFNNLQNNDLMNNDDHVNDQGLNNLIENNYYDDWSGVGSYNIVGSANNKDASPQHNPNHMSSLTLTIDDGDSSELQGNVDFSWISVDDTFDHEIIYSVHYSDNNGLTWISLKTGLKSFNYTLDTSLIADRPNIKFKVQATDEVGFITETIIEDTYTVSNSPQSLSTLSLISPTTGSGLSGYVTIEWTEVTDSRGDDVTYVVSFSSDSGSTWADLTTGLEDTTYTWDTTKVENGDYLIRVVASNNNGLSIEVVSTSLTVDNSVISSSDVIESKSDDTVLEFNFFASILGIFFLILIPLKRKSVRSISIKH